MTGATRTIWPERHVRGVGFVLAVLTVIGFADWVWYLESMIKPSPKGTMDVLRADLGANCGEPKDNILHWVKSACAHEKECNLIFDWNFRGPVADSSCSSRLRIEWRCSLAGRTYSYTVPWGRGMQAPLSCAKQLSMLERNAFATEHAR